jgi:hypothetical protein
MVIDAGVVFFCFCVLLRFLMFGALFVLFVCVCGFVFVALCLWLCFCGYACGSYCLLLYLCCLFVFVALCVCGFVFVAMLGGGVHLL